MWFKTFFRSVALLLGWWLIIIRMLMVRLKGSQGAETLLGVAGSTNYAMEVFTKSYLIMCSISARSDEVAISCQVTYSSVYCL